MKKTNLLYIIYSPNPFSKAVDHSTQAMLQELDYEDLQAWLLDVQTKDAQLQVIRKSIIIKKLEELTKSGIIRQLSEGKIPEVKYNGMLPFNFQKDEKVVWIFQNVEYSEVKERTRYDGFFSSISDYIYGNEFGERSWSDTFIRSEK